ncbi:hypothetical protein M407DRAFT_20440 [Tulasnella calospora MUT 4182]|uniref:UvrD-like helicase ATP-binding domain-containing protein n=1 Tax=Tulasnella calospora MUT 4182 TaxID=1051891 RepID=A0A0C3MA24_9AGAM|nr:hypothetical protein M407DRAFT_20440 [Tulasnella calospora MUT 4182]
MSATLQPEVVHSPDLETALAKFVPRGEIDTRFALDTAIEDLMDVLQSTSADMVSLLGAIARQVNGLLEVVMTSSEWRTEGAFTVRTRILKTIQKSSQYPNPIFITCAERIGVFLISLPPWITLDQDIMTKHHAAYLSSTNVTEPEYFTVKKEKPGEQDLAKPSNAPQPGKRHKRASSISLTIQDPGRYHIKNRRASIGVVKQPPSPTVPMRLGSGLALLEQLRDCLEAYFTACLTEEVEEIALNKLFEILLPPVITFHAQESLEETSREPRSPPASGNPTPSKLKSFWQPNISRDDIIRYLGDATKPKLGEWPVAVSQRGIKHVRKYFAHDNETFERIENTIRQLAMGFFSPSNHAKLLDQDHGIPIYAADVGRTLRLLYHIDFGAPTDSTLESQFIRVFGVFASSEIDITFWKAVSAQLGRRGSEYIRRCKAAVDTPVRSRRSSNTVSPLVLSPLEVSQWNQQGADIEIDESHRLELHRILSLEKFVPLSHTFFDAIQKFNESSFMFSVSPPENRIIKHPSSCLVLGRSGTGKTTCMVFRMIGLDVAARKSDRTLRQVFVTQSRTLARKVRMYCMQLKQTESNATVAATRQPGLGLSLLDMDESAEEEGVLPAKFSELTESHFPLFLTYDQLCRLLEADFNLEFHPSSLPRPKKARTRAKQSSLRQPLISFDYFDSKIWPHFDQRVTKGLHSALVYSEFMGIIKGSEAALSKPRHYLERTDYEKQSNRSLSGEDADRWKIYTLFKAYQKLRPPTSYDVADRVHILVQALQEGGVPGNSIDFLYVDEAQDNLMIDAALLRTLCPNPHGLFFAGDTAQTISVGSAFRFSELKAFLYRLERSDIHVKSGNRLPIDPHFFQLSTNYRSHSGIVNAAAFVVKLLDSYFRHSIDSLAPEVAHVDVKAHKPVFFSGMSNPEDFKRLISDSTSGKVELGAHQVIIVRHDDAASKLRAAIGRVAVVLTLYESKGMEFNDVLLFNFFTDSPATTTDWRAIYLAQNEGRMFNARRHSILQSELKSLYVGLTRARERVWMWEESSDGDVMESLLEASGLASSHRGGQVPQLAVSNLDEEWAEQAQQYFSKSLFSEAELCFERAGLVWWVKVAQAYKARQEAMRAAERDPSQLSEFLGVAQEFDHLAQEGQSTEDQESLRLLFANAGECYALLPDHVPAATAFFKARRFTAAAYHHRMAGCFDEAVEVVRHYDVDPDVAESIKYAAKFVFTTRRDIPSLHKAWKLCDNKDEFLDFLQDHGFDGQRLAFLDSITEHERMAQVLWDDGNYVKAVIRFRQSDTPSSPRKATLCLLEGIRANVPLATSYGNQSDVLSELFTLSRSASLSQSERAEVQFLHSVVNLQGRDLKVYGNIYLDRQDMGNALLALDAWTQSGALDGVQSTSDDEVAEVLALCQKFGSVVNTIVRTPNFFDLPGMHHLFGISGPSPKERADQSKSQEITLQRTVQPSSLIHGLAFVLVDRREQTMSQASPVTLPTNTVDDMMRRALLRRLNAVITRVEDLTQKARAFELCTQFLVYKQCGGLRDGSCWRDHVLEQDMNIQKFNMRFRLHILMITVLNHFTVLYGQFDENIRTTRKKIWIAKLFHLCYPSTAHKTGNLSDITPELIPEYSSAMSIVRCWLHEIFRSLRPAQQVQYFLTNILITTLLSTAFDYMDTASYLWRGKWSLDPQLAQRNGLIVKANGRSAAGCAIVWFARNEPSRANLGLYFLEHVLKADVAVDADVVLALTEEVCGQLILNHYAHNTAGYDYMTMPRSWILRAFARAPSVQLNGTLPWKFAAIIGDFIDAMLFKSRPGLLQMRGSLLLEVSLSIRSQAVERLCRCLALLGTNITGVRDSILSVFSKISFGSPVRPEFQGFALAQNWHEVLAALVYSIGTSPMDGLCTIRRRPTSITSGSIIKILVCPSEASLLNNLRLGRNPPAIALQSDILSPGWYQDRSTEPEAGSSVPNSREWHTWQQPQLESVAFTPEDRRSASIVQAFFCRHKRRAGGPIAAAFEKLIKKCIGSQEIPSIDRHLLLCLRGPLPHVLGYLRTLRGFAESAVQSLNQEMQAINHEEIEEVHAKGVEIRGIRDATNRLIKELYPSSNVYFKRRSNSPSVRKIVEKVREIPNLVSHLRKFADCPEDLDYDLGVEPLLSNRVPWVH